MLFNIKGKWEMKKTICIVVICMLFILTISPIVYSKSNNFQNTSKSEILSGGIWFIRGVFKYLDEDKDYIYLRAIFAKFAGIDGGFAFYRLLFLEIKISKPFIGILLKNTLPAPCIGVCNDWDYI